jgi:hypothetical protein
MSMDVSIEASMEAAIKDDLRLEITDFPPQRRASTPAANSPGFVTVWCWRSAGR